MNVDEIYRKYKLALQNLDTGEFEKALEITNEIKNMGDHYQISNIVGNLLIDIGSVLNKKLVIEGIEMLEKVKEKMIKKKKSEIKKY